MKKIISVVFVIFGLYACSDSADATVPSCGALKNVDYENFSYCGTLKESLRESSFVILSSEEEVGNNFTTCESFAATEFPDFTKKSILVLFAGAKSTGGYTIKIQSIVQDDCQITVEYFETQPKTGDAVTQGVTYPADYVVIPKIDKPVFFKKVGQI